MPPDAIESFITRWENSGAAERANYQMFLFELCDILEHMKRLEAEVLELVTALGGDATFEMNEYKVRPEQFLGLELSHNAVAIAQLVLWIGYFQWQRKTTGKADTGDRPLLPKTQTIRQQDAVLACDEKIPRRDPVSGEILTLRNGHTTQTHPVTGKEVPDESANENGEHEVTLIRSAGLIDRNLSPCSARSTTSWIKPC